MMFSKRETYRRIRLIARQLKQRNGLPDNAPFEVQLRYVPVIVDSFEEAKDAGKRFPDGDDLKEFAQVDQAAGMDHYRSHGAIIHVCVYTPGWPNAAGSELVDVDTGWMGNDTEEARLTR